MLIDSSFDRTLLLRFSIHFGLSLVFVILLLGFGALVDSRSSKNFIASVQAVFRDDQTVSNTALLSRRMADLETLGIVSCLSIRSSTLQEIYNTNFKDGCGEPQIFSFFRWSEGSLRSLSGETFHFRFKMTPNNVYVFYFTTIFLLGLLSINGGLLLYWTGIDAKSRELAMHKALGDLAIQVSHDIRSPLSALSVAIAQTKGIPEANRTLILQVSSRIQGVADDLLQRYRNSSQNKEINAHKTSLRKLLTSIWEEKKLSCKTRPEVSFQLNLPSDQDAFCILDERKLERALSNLTNNAVEAIAQSGTVTLALRLYNANKAAILISDNGSGMPEALLQDLGKKRVSQGKNGRDSGFGLGVWQSKIAVEEFGGTITFQSKIGVGTIVTIVLPTV